jgi:hypothetical protein
MHGVSKMNRDFPFQFSLSGEKKMLRISAEINSKNPAEI